MQDDLVSIITPLYNGERFVRQTIESVLGQTYARWEMIIVNDGSKDNSEQIALSYAAKDTRIKVFSQSNSGSASARNRGIREATGRYMVFLDADDYWDNTFLEEQLHFMRDKDAKIVCASCRRVNEEGKEILRPLIVPEKVGYTDLLKTCSLPCLTTMIDRKELQNVYFHEELRSLRDDYVLWLSLIKQAHYAFGNPKVLASYRLSSQAATANKRKMIRPQFLVYYRVEKLGFVRSVYYLAQWAVRGFLKYHR